MVKFAGVGAAYDRTSCSVCNACIVCTYDDGLDTARGPQKIILLPITCIRYYTYSLAEMFHWPTNSRQYTFWKVIPRAFQKWFRRRYSTYYTYIYTYLYSSFLFSFRDRSTIFFLTSDYIVIFEIVRIDVYSVLIWHQSINSRTYVFLFRERGGSEHLRHYPWKGVFR